MSGYNGWTNFATWKIALELIGDWTNWKIEDGIRYKDKYALAEAMKDEVLQAIRGYGEIDENSIAVNYAECFVDDVNYYEIAEHYEELYTEPEEDAEADDEETE